MLLITDLDHTLADARWRDNMRPDWDAYYRASIDDAAFTPMIEFINSMSLDWDVVCVTTRPEKWRVITMDWLLREGVMIDELVMRPNDDYKSSPELKPLLVKPLIERNGDRVVIAIDDREDVVTAYCAMGICAFQTFPVKLGGK